MQELRQSLRRDLSSDFGADAVKIPESPICLLVDEFLGIGGRVARDQQKEMLRLKAARLLRRLCVLQEDQISSLLLHCTAH